MIIRKGTHYASPLQLLKKLLGIHICKSRKMSCEVSFTESCRYNVGKDQSDINKLFGFHSVYTTRTQFVSVGDGLTATVTSTGGVYKYEGDDWQLWYTITPPLVFKGMTFEQTDYWQKPEMVFRGFSFEVTDKVGGASMFHGMS